MARVPFAQYEQAQKALVVQEHLSAHCGFRCYAVTEALTPTNIDVHLRSVDTVICCTDQVESQRFLPIWCKEHDIRYQRAGYDGDTINVCPSIPLTLETDEVEAADHGYHGVPEVYHAMIAGAMAVYSVFNAPVVILGELAKLAVSDCNLVPQPLRDKIAEDTWRTKATDEGWGPGQRSLEDMLFDNYNETLRVLRQEHENHERGTNRPNHNDWCLYCKIGRLETQLLERQAA